MGAVFIVVLVEGVVLEGVVFILVLVVGGVFAFVGTGFVGLEDMMIDNDNNK